MSDRPAGRDTDRLIAEKVMGFLVIETDDCGGEDNFWLSNDGQNVLQFPDGMGGWPLPSYSTDIGDAWLVWEKASRRSFSPALQRSWNNPELWVVTESDFETRRIVEEAETAPLVICRFALRRDDA